jgi:hypothetical protein
LAQKVERFNQRGLVLFGSVINFDYFYRVN